MRASLAVADHKACQIDREKSRRVNRVGEGEEDQRAHSHERRVQPLRQSQPIEHQGYNPPTDNTDDAAEAGIEHEGRQPVGPALLADQQNFDQQHGQKHRERIVAARFYFQRGAHARAQPQAAGIDQQKYRRGVGGGDRGTDQQRLRPTDSQHVLGDRRGYHRGYQYPERRQRDRRRQHVAEGCNARAQPAIEQDQRQCYRADGICGADIVEFHAAGPALARKHANQQEHQ